MKELNGPLRLRNLLKQGPVFLPGTFYPFGALQIQAAGFDACYISGAALSNSFGLLDEGFVSRDEVVWTVRTIRRVCDLPLVVDCDTGLLPYWRVNELASWRRIDEQAFTQFCLTNSHLDIEAIAPTVEDLEKVGVAAIHIEDQHWYWKRCGHLEGKQVILPKDMAEKIRIAVKVRQDPNFMIIARTDARAPEGLDRAIERANIYLAAGADAIFPEALGSEEEFAQFRAAIPRHILLVANLAEQGMTPATISAGRLVELGYQMILFPVTGTRAMFKAFRDILDDIRKYGKVRNVEKKVMSRMKVNDLLRSHSRMCKK